MIHRVAGLGFWLLVPSLAWGADFPPSIDAEIQSAHSAGIPVSPLEDKAREGLAKRVPEARIVLAIQDLERRLGQAMDALGEPLRGEDALVVAAAAALYSGATADGVAHVANVRTAYRLTAMTRFADLLAAGLSEQEALTLIDSAAGSPAPDRAFGGLATAVATLLASDVPSDSVVKEVASAVDEGRSPLSAIPPEHGGPPAHSNAGGLHNGSDKGNGSNGQ